MSPIDVFMVAVYVAFSLMVIAGGDDQVFADAVDVSAAAELDESDEPQPASTGIAAMPTMAVVARSRLMAARIPVSSRLKRDPGTPVERPVVVRLGQ